MPTTITIQKAGKNDWNAICHLLAADNLPTVDLNPALEHFFIAIAGTEITGVIGMDKYDHAGLLRSAVVKASHRNTGVAAALVKHLFDEAGQQGITALYLITNTAAAYFEKKGFQIINREQVPITVLQSKEFNGLCPSSSAIMFRHLQGNTHH
ncbi:MAG: arsenic resistance N-acetyltransferase ArsN2 [Chitinophagaceae bacterium]